MSYKVELSLRAERDLEHILVWLSERSLQGASSWYRRWKEMLLELSEMPETCQLAPEDVDHPVEIRHIIFKTRHGKNYRALFVIHASTVFVTNLRGPGQDLVAPDQLTGPNS